MRPGPGLRVTQRKMELEQEGRAELQIQRSHGTFPEISPEAQRK